jgi:hypothetical protein
VTAGVLGLVLVACGPQRPDQAYEVSVVGRVTGYDGSSVIITTPSGGATALDSHEPFEGRPVATEGELLLGAEVDGTVRYVIAFKGAPEDEECPFYVNDANSWGDGDALILESGLRLLKAPDFTGMPRVAEGHMSPVLCVDEVGRAVEAR